MSYSQSNLTRPIWLDTASLPKFPTQAGQVTVDVCIIGAGITGLTAADLLKRAGKTVAVIDLARVGSGETSHTTAHLTEVFDIDYAELISHFGLDGAKLAAQSMRRSIQRIEDNAAAYGIDCDFERTTGYRFTENRGDAQQLETDAENAEKIGVATELLFEAPLPFKTARAVRFDNQARFSPLKYLNGLAQRIPGDGSFIFEDTRMLDVEEGEPCRVHTDRGTIVADDVFVATNVPSTNWLFLHTKLAAYRTYAIAARVNSRSDEKSLFWDILDPYHYVRSVDLGGVPHLIVGGEDHKTGKETHTSVHFENLETWANERFNIETVTHRWSGQVIEPVDGLPFIGRNPLADHVYVSSGYSGTGLTMGTIGGMLVSDLILGEPNPWAELYDAGRVKPLASMKNFLAENIDFPTAIVSDRFTALRGSDPETIRENEGAIVRVGSKKMAAYRDPEGAVHLMSPVCPHMGCFVHWNDAEKSWDCPCHGSRFNPVGKLLNGPAVTDLASEDYDENMPLIPERYDQPQPTDAMGTPILGAFSCPCKLQPS